MPMHTAASTIKSDTVNPALMGGYSSRRQEAARAASLVRRHRPDLSAVTLEGEQVGAGAFLVLSTNQPHRAWTAWAGNLVRGQWGARPRLFWLWLQILSHCMHPLKAGALLRLSATSAYDRPPKLVMRYNAPTKQKGPL